jgi:hypothetical protein
MLGGHTYREHFNVGVLPTDVMVRCTSRASPSSIFELSNNYTQPLTLSNSCTISTQVLKPVALFENHTKCQTNSWTRKKAASKPNTKACIPSSSPTTSRPGN